MMLGKCSNHGFEDIAQLSIFHNALRFDTVPTCPRALTKVKVKAKVKQGGRSTG